jgi:hypothetical protein
VTRDNSRFVLLQTPPFNGDDPAEVAVERVSMFPTNNANNAMMRFA